VRELSLAQADFVALAAEVLAAGGSLRFRARGGSMTPSIRNGDIVTVEPAAAASLRVGDVALCHEGGRALVHRVVGMSAEGETLRIRLAGDAGHGAEERIGPGQVLGRVVRVEPQGHDSLLRRGIRYVLQRLQNRRAYRALGRRLLSSSVEYVVGEVGPPAAQSSSPEGDAPPAAQSSSRAAGQASDAQSVGSASVAAHLAGRAVGHLHLRSAPEDDWLPGFWIFDVEVVPRARGLGIGQGLMETALRAAGSQGATAVSLFVFADNHRAIAMFRKLGFHVVERPAQQPMLRQEEERGGRPRLVMSRPIDPAR
jgi:ribosomal protein S18 acetylase RimI-like enzyme